MFSICSGRHFVLMLTPSSRKTLVHRLRFPLDTPSTMRAFYPSLALFIPSLLPSVASFSTQAGSIGEAIQIASNQDELLSVASQFWLPFDSDLPSHLRSQRVHHEKRQRWSAQLLDKLSLTALNEPLLVLEDLRLQRAILAASIPFQDEPDRPSKEGRYVQQALLGLHTLVGKTTSTTTVTTTVVSKETMDGVRQLIDRADAMAPSLPLPQVVAMRFAARGLLSRLQQDLKLKNMDDRVSNLPFEIIPQGVHWDQLVSSSSSSSSASAALLDVIPFRFDTITTRTGSVVVERRGTAWLAESDIGALAYSGKLMPPKAVPPLVSDTMRAVESAIGMGQKEGGYFNCALCNHYPDADAACKFHTDPEHGTVWERLTCVVAAGDSRKFAFRPIPGESQWSAWDTPSNGSVQQDETAPAAVHLFSGDIVTMWGECNDVFHHAVYTAEGDNHVSSNGRVSLVLKRAMDRGGGRRGHGLKGTGRRASRRSRS